MAKGEEEVKEDKRTETSLASKRKTSTHRHSLMQRKHCWQCIHYSKVNTVETPPPPPPALRARDFTLMNDSNPDEKSQKIVKIDKATIVHSILSFFVYKFILSIRTCQRFTNLATKDMFVFFLSGSFFCCTNPVKISPSVNRMALFAFFLQFLF